MRKVSAFSMAVVCWLIPAGIVCATDFPLSQYGQIQNVQSYSSNPFHNPDSPYNQRLPTPIYAQGTELNAGECRNIVDVIVSGLCAQRNNCQGLSLSDIRPSVILQLSNLTGHNYVTSCNGYIQPSFEDYMKNNSAVKVTGFPSAFPTANTTKTVNSSNELVINNPYELKDADWEKDKTTRQNELRNLQRQNGSNNVALAATKFPATYGDLSFTERMENDQAGYESWKGTQAYKPIKVESDLNRYQRETEETSQKTELEEKQKDLLKLTNHLKWCLMYPTDCLKENEAAIKSACRSWVSDGMPYPAPIVNDYRISEAVCGDAIMAQIEAEAAAATAAAEVVAAEAAAAEEETNTDDEPIVIDLG